MKYEYEFWEKYAKLEEDIQKLSVERNPDYSQLLRDEKMMDFVYKKLRVIGGAYILADKSKNRLVYLQNKELQEEDNHNLPFIEIPYRYRYHQKKEENDKNSIPKESKYKNLIDALFIDGKDKIFIQKGNLPPPDIYRFLPGVYPKDKQKKLLPFEHELAKGGQKIYYCVAGEIIFHLYIWRVLFRLAQTRGLRNGELERYEYEEDFKLKYKFWLNFPNTKIKSPEANWMESLSTKYAGKEKVSQKIQQQWEHTVTTLDKGLLRKGNYTFYDEYEYLGLLEKDEKNKMDIIPTKDFLQLVQYLIYVAETHLNWKVEGATEGGYQDDKNTTSSINPNVQIPDNKILTLLYVLKQKLYLTFSENDDEDSEKITLKKLKEEFNFDRCWRRVAKEYLFRVILDKNNNQEEKISTCLQKLHQNTRFPVLPYYYEMATGDYHVAKEHLVLGIWNSPDNPVFINSEKKGDRIAESTVAFLSLTLLPVWRLDKHYNFTKNNESIYYAKYLSKGVLNTVFRIKTFFGLLFRPLIDKVFYGEMIKHEIERSKTSTDINALSHELSKITDNIFNLSNVTLDDYFGKETSNQMKSFLTSLYLEKNRKLRKQKASTELQKESEDFRRILSEVSDWRLIPNFNRFTLWNKCLALWTGRRGELVLDLPNDASLINIISNCQSMSAKMRAGYLTQNTMRSKTMKSIEEYQQKFDAEVKQLNQNNIHIFYDRGESFIGSYQLKNKKNSDEQSELLIGQNAFLRILVAAITNILEHTSGDFALFIRKKKDYQGREAIRFCFINPIKERSLEKKQKSMGTEPVLNSCLTLVNGNLEIFGQPEGTQLQYWKHKIENQRDNFMNRNQPFWLTKFVVPANEIFTTPTKTKKGYARK